MQIRRVAAALTSAAALSVSGVAMATPAQAAGPIVTGGLVNVTIVDAVDVTIRDVDVALGLALQLAANVCDVNVLAVDIADGATTCTNDVTGQTVTIQQM